MKNGWLKKLICSIGKPKELQKVLSFYNYLSDRKSSREVIAQKINETVEQDTNSILGRSKVDYFTMTENF